MNLYDKDDGFRRFSLEEANALLPEIIAATQEAVSALSALQRRFKQQDLPSVGSEYDRFEEESAAILQDWAEKMVGLGVYPKGYFTVDFKSPIPDTLFCWTYGEEEISHSHKVYETFKERIPIERRETVGFEQSLN